MTELYEKLESWANTLINHFKLDKTPYFSVILTVKNKIVTNARDNPEQALKWLRYIRAQINLILDDTNKK